MRYDAKQDSLFEAVKRLVLETRNPSIALVQRTFRIGYSRAKSMLEAIDGVVSTHAIRGGGRDVYGCTENGRFSMAIEHDWGDAEMTTFDSTFFNDLARMDVFVKLNEYDSVLMPPLDGFRLRLSQLQRAGKVSEDFVGLTRNFVIALEMRSDGRYAFEEDFAVLPNHISSFSKHCSGRKQLYVGFDAHPPSELYSRPWGVSIGLGFDFYNKQGIAPRCVSDYETFHEKVYCDPELFDVTFGQLGGYSEGCGDAKEPVTAEMAWQSAPDMLQRWLFFGKRLSSDDVAMLPTLDEFVDECIRIFDLICDAGYFEQSNSVSYRRLWRGSSMSIERFVTFPANQLAHAAALHAMDSVDMINNPLFIHGGTGSGKTHLLQAIGNRFMTKNRLDKIGYVHACTYISDVVAAYLENRFDEFRKFYCSLDLLLIDDIQFMAGKQKSQEELYVVINSLIEGNRQIVITCDTAPSEIAGIMPALQSRFSGGLSVEIEQPDMEARQAVAMQMSKHDGKPIPDEVAHFIAQLALSNMREIQGALNRLWAFSNFHKRPIDLVLAKEALKDLQGNMG